MLAAGLSMSAQAQVKSTTLQAVFIYSAIKYMEWPEDNAANFEIVIVGESPLYEELVKVAQTKKAGAKKIEVTSVNNIADIRTNPHILFVAANKTNQLHKFAAGGKASVLIITEANGALKSGSDLNFIQRGDKMTFQISEESLAEKKIKVSSSFATLAEK